MNPDDVARSARRIASKMVADQATELMISMVGMVGTGDGQIKPTERFAVVLVARGGHADRVLRWIKSQEAGEPMVEVVPV